MADGKEPLTKKERLNRNIVIACMLAGGVIGILFSALGHQAGAHGAKGFVFSEDFKLSPAIAISFVVFWAGIMPAIAWYWHRHVIDEQEANAYRDGAYYAGYAYLIAAPTWWFLARGGLVPAADGVILYIGFALIWSIVWFWKKYRN